MRKSRFAEEQIAYVFKQALLGTAVGQIHHITPWRMNTTSRTDRESAKAAWHLSISQADGQ